MVGSAGYSARLGTGLLFVSFFAYAFTLGPAYVLSAFWASVGLVIICLELPSLRPQPGSSTLSHLHYYATYPYVIAGFSALILCNNETNRGLLAILVAAVFWHDVGAYVSGSAWGKHAMAPRISPKKTWEGFLGGYVCTYGLLWAMCIFLQKYFGHIEIAVIAAAVAALATIGDLYESWLKRSAGVKDSGVLLPGHGGLFDRFDSMLPVALLCYGARSYLISLL